MANERLNACFNAVRNAGRHLAELHATRRPDELAGYRLLRECLTNVLAVKPGAYSPF